MRRFRALGFVVCGLALHALGQSPTAGAPSPPTIASAVDREISGAERQLVEAAEAMPEDRFDFSPENVKIPGADYKGVRTFAQEVKHVAASNYFLFASVTGEKIPDDFKGGNGPAAIKTKAEILSTRFHLATFAVAHAFDHYGQMIEYLRMNGIVPPASRGKAD
jgi:hypothetical protein